MDELLYTDFIVAVPIGMGGGEGHTNGVSHVGHKDFQDYRRILEGRTMAVRWLEVITEVCASFAEIGNGLDKWLRSKLDRWLRSANDCQACYHAPRFFVRNSSVVLQ